MVEVVEVKRMMDGIGWNKPNSMETLNDPIHYIKFSSTGRMEDTKLETENAEEQQTQWK